jgi:2'-hydroxyisoflavone reductase
MNWKRDAIAGTLGVQTGLIGGMEMTTRRDFMRLSAVAVGGLGLAPGALSGDALPVPRASKRLKILFLGGTGFIGPHQVRYALDRGHEVTVFNRGRKSGLFGDQVEEIVGNRDTKIDEGLVPLRSDRTWDAVIDNSGYIPRHVRDSVELLKGRVGRYLYISTVAVYDFDKGPRFPEQGPLAVLEDPAIEEVTWETYGPLKAECDRIVRNELGDAATVVRPTYIVGPGDTTDRFTYWVDRVHRGGDMLAPSDPDHVVQWVDARDLCPWVIDLVERDVAGTFNAAGPASDVTREGLMWGLRATTAAPVRFWWPSGELLDELEISPPMLPTPTSGFSGGGSTVFDNLRSLAEGLTYRPLADTAAATLEWWRAQPPERRSDPRGWIPDEKERAAIAKLRG